MNAASAAVRPPCARAQLTSPADRGGRSGRGGRGGGAPKAGERGPRPPRPAANGYSNGDSSATPTAWGDTSAATPAPTAWGASTTATDSTADAWDTATAAIDSTPATTDAGWGGDASPAPVASPPVQSAKSKGKAPAVRSFGAAGGMSWAQIARKQEQQAATPPPAPVAAPQPPPPVEEPAPEPSQPGLPQPPPVVVSIPKSAAPAPTPEPLQGLTSTDPWASTPAAAATNSAPADAWSDTPAAARGLPNATSPAALAIGEGWAETVLADDHPGSFGATTRQTALANAPPAGVDPAGPLEQSSAAPAKPTKHDIGVGPDPPSQVSTPPGLAKRPAPVGRLQQDQAVVMPQPIGAGATERIGMQFGSLNLFGNHAPVADEPAKPVEQPKPIQPASRSDMASAYGQQHQTPVQQILAPEARVPSSNAFEGPQQPSSAMSHHSAPQQGAVNPAQQALPQHAQQPAYGYPYQSAYQDGPAYAAPGGGYSQQEQQQHSMAAYFQAAQQQAQHQQQGQQSTGSPAQQPQQSASPPAQQQANAYQPFAAPGADYAHTYGQSQQPQQADSRYGYYDQYQQPAAQAQYGARTEENKSAGQAQAPPGIVRRCCAERG